jgi:ribosome-associated translation inhibitor RaiA
MANLLNPAIELLEDSPEVKSYIYQQISEFEPYVTPQTVIAVISKNPRRLALQYEAEGKEFDMEDLASHFRISITLTDGDAKITAEGLDKNIFAAIRFAKENLLRKLVAIQDKIVSQQERNMAIHHALQNTMIH